VSGTRCWNRWSLHHLSYMRGLDTLPFHPIPSHLVFSLILLSFLLLFSQGYSVFCLHGSPRLFSLLVHLPLPSFYCSSCSWCSHQAFLFSIDHGDEILGNCGKNLELNSSLFHPHTVVNVRELNWMSDWPIQDTHGDCRDPQKYS